GPSVVPYSVCAPHLPLCLDRLHLWFLILYVPLTFPSVWTGSICGSSFCMYPSPSPLSGHAPSVVPHSRVGGFMVLLRWQEDAPCDFGLTADVTM
ncbi:hypothetical protein XELAEV_18038334mg, partial [Xenopus laevis]